MAIDATPIVAAVAPKRSDAIPAPRLEMAIVSVTKP
jgi:hypothetical protein